MANWTNQTPLGATSNRRKWKVEDRTSLNNLKQHIAEEGCSEIQYDLAKQLLDDTEVEDYTNSRKQAVHWLLLASQQGHEGACKLLQQCYDEGCGINAENEAEVRYCLSMTPGVRAARKAARELFACLSNGNEHITPKQLERKMRRIYKLQKKRRPGEKDDSTDDTDSETECKPLEGTASLKRNGDMRRSSVTKSSSNIERHGPAEYYITEDHLVSAADNYSAGLLPTVNNALTVSVPHPSSLDHVPCFHRLILHPVIFLTLLYHRFINLISTFPTTVPANVRFALLLFVSWLVTNENATVFLPLGLYYLCLSVMIWSTCKMLKSKHDFIDFRIWSGLFLRYGDHNIEAEVSENRFLKNNMQPYLYFFCAFVGNLLIHPLVDEQWLPHSELTIVSVVFVFVSMCAFMYSSAPTFPDWTVLVSFGVNVLAKYPYEMDEVVTTGWRFMDLKVPTFGSFVIGNGIEFCLNCRTALYFLIPVLMALLAKRSNWRGTYVYLIPHCVTLSWLQLCIHASQSATMFGVVRATLGLAGILLFLPLFGLVSLLVPVFVAIEWMGITDTYMRLGSTAFVMLIAVLVSSVLAVNQRTQKYVTALQLIICVLAAGLLTFPHMTTNFKDSPRFHNIFPNHKHGSIINSQTNGADLQHDTNLLSWKRFYMHCGQSAWEEDNKIKAQLRCANLQGMAVQWEGTVQQVQIVRATNPLENFVSRYLPRWLASVVRCLYGVRISEQLKCDQETDSLCVDLERLLQNHRTHSDCTLQNWNSYDYEIRVKMATALLSKTIGVVLQADNHFGNFTHRIVHGDRIKFHGTLHNNRLLLNGEEEDFMLGVSHAYVKLNAIECISCRDQQLEPVNMGRFTSSAVDARLRDLMRGFKYLLNVLLNPLITFK